MPTVPYNSRTKVTKVTTRDQTLVKKVVVGRPIRRVKSGLGSIDTLQGIDTSAKTDGSVLVYNEGRSVFEATLNIEKQNVNGGLY